MTSLDIQGFPKNKKDQSIHDIIAEIVQQKKKEDDENVRNKALDKDRSGNLTRQTVKTSDRHKSSRGGESDNLNLIQNLKSENTINENYKQGPKSSTKLS